MGTSNQDVVESAFVRISAPEDSATIRKFLHDVQNISPDVVAKCFPNYAQDRNWISSSMCKLPLDKLIPRHDLSSLTPSERMLAVRKFEVGNIDISSYSRRHPYEFEIGPWICSLGYDQRNWKSLVVFLVNLIWHEHHNVFEQRACAIHGRTKQYVTRDPTELTRPVQIAQSEFYVETCLSSGNAVAFANSFARIFDYMTPLNIKSF